MEDHECRQAVHLGQMDLKIDTLLNIAKDNQVLLKGNGKPGLVTEVALLKDRQGLLWGGLGVVATAAAGALIKLFF